MSEKIETLIMKQTANMDSFDRFVVNFRKCSKANLTPGYLKGRIEGLADLWRQFKELHGKILLKVDDASKALPYFQNDSYSHYEEIYYDYFGKITDLRDQGGSPATSSATREINLRPITLPTFSGKYSEWQPFSDLFQALVGNNQQLTGVQKLHYLRSSVSGEAEHLLRSYNMVEINFEPAWSALCKRFSNNRLLINAQLAILFNNSPISRESAATIRNLLDSTNESLSALKSLMVRVDDWDLAIIYVQSSRLPSETRTMWEEKLSLSTEPPTLAQYLEFLETRFRTLEAVSSAFSTTPCKTTSLQKHAVLASTNSITCSYCKQHHHMRKCQLFQALPYDQRLQIVRNKSLCFNCLATDHSSKMCPSKRSCVHCGRRHHTSIHEDSNQQLNSPNSSGNRNLVSSYVVNQSIDTVLLATALVKIPSNGTDFILRALIDPGSQVSFITTAAMQRLRLKPLNIITKMTISGIGNTKTGHSQKVVHFKIKSMTSKEFILPVEAIVLPSLTGRLPQTRLSSARFSHLRNLDLADPLYYQPSNIDLILGSDAYPNIIKEGIKKGPSNTPIAQNTALGWILMGPVRNEPRTSIKAYSFFNQLELDSQLRRFWELEEVETVCHRDEDTVRCEDHFKSTHKRNAQGRYIVSLPFKTNPAELGSSFKSASSQLISLERRLCRHTKLRSDYERCLGEYIELNHMEKIPEEDIKTKLSYYLPHHGVIKETSVTTKLRVVFNASCKSDKGNSLNDILHVGPSLQQDLSGIITRWRMHRIVFAADMEKMYRQVLVSETDRDFQRILWRRNPSAHVEHFRLSTVTFGVSTAPFLAMRVIQQLVDDEGLHFPLASKILTTGLYVDNVMGGANDLREVLRTQEELISLLSRGGFHLRQWASNDPLALKTIPEEDWLKSNPLQFQDTTASTVKTLGLEWNHMTDNFLLKFHMEHHSEICTKRSMLSCIAKLFDPLGWYAPVTVTAKILVQKLWLLGLSWDQPLPEKYKVEWNKFKNDLPQLEEVKISRWLQTENQSEFELHGFCDASEQAYSAAVYLRVSGSNRTGVNVSLIMAKTKIAPIKTISLPRLELSGAALLAKLLSRVIRILEQHEVPVHCWTDSTIVLAWLAKLPCSWKTFVAIRTSTIRELIPMAIWHHVISRDNPADLATRGISPTELKFSTLWWHGPDWLSRSANDWPTQNAFTTTQDIRKIISFVAQTSIDEGTIMNLSDFSSYTKLIRVTAYALRFIQQCRRQTSIHQASFLSSQELDKASFYWIRAVQRAEYNEEIQSLKSTTKINDKSKIKGFIPFLDKDDILRIGGRLHHSHLSYEERHPIILPHGSHLTKLLISIHHLKTLHGGLTATLSSIRRKYWAPKLRNTIKAHIHRCIKCFRLSKEGATQLMGNLPSERITPAPPFKNTGIDYAGPLTIRMSKGRNPKTHKGYIALFICFVTKAIHLEAVSDLTTDAFLAALRRFIGRRGHCKNIFTDCGTNFVGAKASLQKTFIISLHKATREVAELLANDGINWVFIPPGSPHFGGLWEAGVRSMKHHLRRIMGNTILTYEELTTVLIQIEACLNSRPLSPLTDNPAELTPLTPGHFLIGRALTAPPQDDLTDTKIIGLRRWILTQKIQQDFWKRWQREYLHTLQHRQKWKNARPNLKVGQLVIVKDERLPPLKWMLGRISAVYPGSDGLVRVVDLKTASSTIRRPIHKICPLPDHKE